MEEGKTENYSQQNKVQIERTPQSRHNNQNELTDIELIEDFSYMDDDSEKDNTRLSNVSPPQSDKLRGSARTGFTDNTAISRGAMSTKPGMNPKFQLLWF